MEVRLLGPVELEIGGVRVDVGGPRAQAVLALLAVRADEVVTADWLIDQLWGERPPRAARVALQSYISRLRRLAVPDSERLVPRHPRGYRLDLSVVEVDASCFARLSEQGRGQAAAGRWREALQSLRSALALWRGVPFSGIDEVPALTAERGRLEELRVETRFSELEAALEIVGPAEVIGPLRELTDTYPWHERGWRLLMLTLYRAGRQSEALEAGARARRLLVEGRGLDPSRELTELEHRILIHDPALEPSGPPPIQRLWSLAVPPTPLIGRERELAEVLAEWEVSSRSRRSRLVLVEGEPGVGKSHLVAELARNVEERGDEVLVGRCMDEPQLPLQPWSDLLPDVVFPALHTPLPPGEGQPLVDVWEVSAHRLFLAVTEQFRKALQSRATLMVAEDIHWAGVAALRLLDHVLASCADLPLLVVATVRSTASDMPPTTRGALGELAARVQPVRLRLDGLDARDLHAMLISRGHRVNAEEAAAVWKRTGGVPLLAIEAVSGDQGLIDARFARLSGTARNVADLLAVVGDSVALAVLRAASGLGEEVLATALDELIAAGLVRAAPGASIAFEFCHALYREALVRRLSDPRRLVLSRRVLAASDVLPQVVMPSTVARHALVVAQSGVPADIVRARDACRRAGAWSTTCHEHQEAVRWLSEARDLAWQSELDEGSVAELELEYGLACRRAGLPQAREAFLRAAALARRRADHQLLARIGLGWSRGFFAQVGRVDDDFVAVLRDALDPPKMLPEALRARTMAALAAELTWAIDGDKRFGLADAALDLARSTGDAATLAWVLQARHLTVAAADTLDVRRRDTEELLALSEQLDDVGLRFQALFHRTGPAIEDGDVRLIEKLLADAGRIADLLRQPALQWSIGWSRASLLLWQGALSAAEKLAHESADQGVRAGHQDEALAFLGGQLTEIRRLQGRLNELVPMLVAVPTSQPDGFSVARYLYDAGRIDAARARLEHVQVHDGRLRLRRDLLERPSLDNLAFLAARLGRTDLAAMVRARLEPLANTFGHGVVAHPVGHHWLGLLALAADQPDEAIAHLRQAVARHAALDLPLLEAESWGELARAYEAQGEQTAAADARTTARSLAASHGANGLLAGLSQSSS